MRTSLLVACGLIVPGLLCGCDGDDPAPQTVAPPAANAPASPPPAATLPARNFPEDLTVDAERDPHIRERAKELNAIAVAEMKNLTVGDEVIVLVRGDKGGGTIYGSGP